jgi:predicted transcriptional regulator
MRRSGTAIFEFLSTSSEPITYQQIAKETGLKSPKSALSKLKKKGLVENVGKNQWALTGKGKDYLGNQLGKPAAAVTGETPISMEDIFRDVGKHLWFESAKDQPRLDEIVYYVGAIAGFADPVKIWNALTDYGLSPRVKYTWIKLFLVEANPWQQMPRELEEKYCSLLEDLI